MFTIYTLTDPRTSSVFYVGKTRLKLNERLRVHLSDCKSGFAARQLRISEIINAGLSPIIREIDNAETDREAEEMEGAWINRFHKQGSKLENTLKIESNDVARATKYNGNSLHRQLKQAVINNKHLDFCKRESSRAPIVIENDLLLPAHKRILKALPLEIMGISSHVQDLLDMNLVQVRAKGMFFNITKRQPKSL